MPLRILTIDDDPAITEPLALFLKTQGFDILTANTGAEAIRLIREASPDIVLLDLVMPDMDGAEVCRAVRKFSNLPILILSALDLPGKVAGALDAGADDYLVKPVPNNVLIARLRRFAQESDRNKKSKHSTHPLVAAS